jgi:putative transcriptional regulator
MTAKTRAQSPLLEAVHDTAKGLHDHVFITKRLMNEFEALCLEPVPDYSSAQIRKLRTSLKISQSVLAGVLNISVSTVRKWNRARRSPAARH